MPPFDGAAHIYAKIVKPFFLDVKEDAGNSWTQGTAKSWSLSMLMSHLSLIHVLISLSFVVLVVKEAIGNVIKND